MSLAEAVAHFNAGRLDAAAALAEAALARKPDDGDALNLLGGVAQRRGDAAGAVTLLRRARLAQPRNPFIHFNLGEALRQSGDVAGSLAPYERAAKLKPDFAEAHAHAGEALRALGRAKQAEAAYRAALGQRGDLPVALNGLGLLQSDAGDAAGAAANFEAALNTDPSAAAIWANLGAARLRLGAPLEGVEALCAAVARAPGEVTYGRLLAAELHNLAVTPRSDLFRTTLIALLARDDINPRTLAIAASQLVAERAHSVEALLADDLFRALAVAAPIPHLALERMLTTLRRAWLLGEATPRDEDVVLLARQCFLNEYVYFADAEEQRAVAAQAPRARDWPRLALIACYRPLAGLPIPEETPPTFAALRREQVEEPVIEASLRASIETLRPPSDDTSRAVQAMYEESPYPRWTRAARAQPHTLQHVIAAALPLLDKRATPKNAAREVLVAGCGTGFETMRALNTYDGATITAIDLSRTSLAYGMRKLAEIGATNVRCVQCDILDVDQLGQSFDVVESFGVIHHMADPEAGLHALTRALKPGGVLHVGLYSTIARTSVVAARDFIAARGYPQTPDGVRQARHDLMALDPCPPELAPILNPASDFWTTSDLRDLIFHVNEHRFTLLEIEALFARAGLSFLGLQCPTEADAARFRARFPAPEASRSLSNWHQFEIEHPETFGGTYSLWAIKPLAA